MGQHFLVEFQKNGFKIRIEGQFIDKIARHNYFWCYNQYYKRDRFGSDFHRRYLQDYHRIQNNETRLLTDSDHLFRSITWWTLMEIYSVFRHKFTCNWNGVWVGTWPICFPKKTCPLKNTEEDSCVRWNTTEIVEIGNVYYLNESQWFVFNTIMSAIRV